MAVAPTPVAAAPDAPDRAQRATFSARATAFFDWIKNTFVAGVNALASNVYANAQDAASSAANAVAQSASATAQAGIATAQAAAATSAAATATTQAGVATTQAASITTAAATSTAKADVATAKAAEATAAAATATAIVLGVSTGYPIIRPSLTLDFANSQIFDPRITFTRASSGTRTNERGLIESLASGVPRIDFDPVTLACKGLLVEEQRTNLLTYSEQFDNAAWGKSRITLSANAATAPDGTNTAELITQDTGTGDHSVLEVLSFTSGTIYTGSVYFKAGSAVKAAIWLQSLAFGTNKGIVVDLSTGAFAANVTAPDSYSITPLGNGWFRVSVTATASSTTSASLVIGMTKSSNQISYTGACTSGIYVWGAQLEAGAFPTSYIPSSVTHTGRASTATFIGSNGLIQSAVSGAARYSYNPLNLSVPPALLLEAAATNLLTYSEQFDNAAWAKNNSSVSANTTTAPDGTSTADSFAENSALAEHALTYPVTVACNQSMSASIYVKAVGRSVCDLVLDDLSYTNRISASFNLASGACNANSFGTGSGARAEMVSVGGGWYRVQLSGIPASSGSTTRLVIYAATDYDGLLGDSLRYYQGNSTTSFYLWGAQLETGSYPTSYIPTTTATVTRAADTSTSAATTRAAEVAAMTGTNFSSWYRADEGTFSLSWAQASTTSTSDVFALFRVSLGGVDAIEARVGYDTFRRVRAYGYVAGSYQYVADDLASAGSSGSCAVAWRRDTSDFALSANGAPVVADVTGSLSAAAAPTNILLGQGFSYYLNGHIRSLRYYPARLTNAQLQTLTQE